MHDIRGISYAGFFPQLDETINTGIDVAVLKIQDMFSLMCNVWQQIIGW